MRGLSLQHFFAMLLGGLGVHHDALNLHVWRYTVLCVAVHMYYVFAAAMQCPNGYPLGLAS